MKYNKIIHYSKCKRLDGHPGGVEKFAWYLQKAMGCDIVTPNDSPVLNDPKTLYIVDNHWGLDIDDKCRVICMLHGCAGERGFNKEIGQKQYIMARRPNTRFVANSLETSDLCKKYYNSRIDDIIHLAVDESFYYPSNRNAGPKIILTTTAKKYNKGQHVIEKIKHLYPRHFKVVDMDCAIGNEAGLFKIAYMFVLLSIHEGFAYSVLEAMCANLPVITGPHGLGYEMVGKNVIDILPENKLWDAVAVSDKILEILNRKDQPCSRKYILDNYSLASFNEKWKELIKKEQLI